MDILIDYVQRVRSLYIKQVKYIYAQKVNLRFPLIILLIFRQWTLI